MIGGVYSRRQQGTCSKSRLPGIGEEASRGDERNVLDCERRTVKVRGRTFKYSV